MPVFFRSAVQSKAKVAVAFSLDQKNNKEPIGLILASNAQTGAQFANNSFRVTQIPNSATLPLQKQGLDR